MPSRHHTSHRIYNNLTNSDWAPILSSLIFKKMRNFAFTSQYRIMNLKRYSRRKKKSYVNRKQAISRLDGNRKQKHGGKKGDSWKSQLLWSQLKLTRSHCNVVLVITHLFSVFHRCQLRERKRHERHFAHMH